MATTYTTHGSVRGACGHNHRSVRTASECIGRDRAGCKAQGGYTDRQVKRMDGADMTQDELMESGSYE